MRDPTLHTGCHSGAVFVTQTASVTFTSVRVVIDAGADDSDYTDVIARVTIGHRTGRLRTQIR